MSESKHTPGPWQSEGVAIYAQGSVDTYSGAVLVPLAHVEDTSQVDPDGRLWTISGDRGANARLIAAAPVMFEYLAKQAAAGDPAAAEIMEAIHAGK